MQKQMLAVVKEKPETGVVIKKVPVPIPGPGEVLVKVLNASICGTDIGIYNWTPWAAGHIKPPIVIGHEVVGEVIEINDSLNSRHSGEDPTKAGDDTRISSKNTDEILNAPSAYQDDRIDAIKFGDIVSSETHIFCGNCYQCRIGNLHICENMELFGIGRNGGFAEFATIPIRTSWKNDTRIPLDAMSVAEPLGNAVHVVQKAHVAGKKVLVVGLGPTGLCAGMVAKVYGASEVVGVNRREFRRKLAERIGFDRVLETIPESEFNSFDAVLEMSGSQAGLQIGFDAARIAGTLIAFGIPKQDITINWGKYLINKELNIGSVFGRRIWETWYQTSSLLTSGKIDLTKIITHRYKLSEFEKAMEVMISGNCGKVLLEIG